MNFKDFQKVIKEEVSLDEMDSIMDIVNYTESVKDSEFASEDELATELKEMLNSIGLDFDEEALKSMEDSVEIPLTYMDDGSAEAILSVFAQDGEGKEIDGELTLKVERLGEGKFDTTILAKFGEDEAKELGDIEFELAEESEEDYEKDIDERCWGCGEELDRGGNCMNHTCPESADYDGEGLDEEITDNDDFEDGYDPIYEAKAVSVSQQRAAGAALAAKRGDVPVSKLVGASKEMYDSMSEKELRKMAKVKHSKLNEEDEEGYDMNDLPDFERPASFARHPLLEPTKTVKCKCGHEYDSGDVSCPSCGKMAKYYAKPINEKCKSKKRPMMEAKDDEKKKPDGMENETPNKKDETPETGEAPVEETEKKYIMSEKELRAVVSWLLKNEDKIEATEEGIDGAVAEIEATFADEFEDEEGEEGEEESGEAPEPESDDSEMPMMEPEEDPNSPVEIYEEVRYDAAWNVILYKPHKRYFISKLFGKDEVKSKNDIENYVKKNYPDFMIFHIFDITEVF